MLTQTNFLIFRLCLKIKLIHFKTSLNLVGISLNLRIDKVLYHYFLHIYIYMYIFFFFGYKFLNSKLSAIYASFLRHLFFFFFFLVEIFASSKIEPGPVSADAFQPIEKEGENDMQIRRNTQTRLPLHANKFKSIAKFITSCCLYF